MYKKQTTNKLLESQKNVANNSLMWLIGWFIAGINK